MRFPSDIKINLTRLKFWVPDVLECVINKLLSCRMLLDQTIYTSLTKMALATHSISQRRESDFSHKLVEIHIENNDYCLD